VSVEPSQASLQRWLRRQLRADSAVREHLEAAIVANDPGEARRLLGAFEFSDPQRRHVEELIAVWERSLDETA
jgi:hypothetical protein